MYLDVYEPLLFSGPRSPVCCHGGAGAKWPPRQVSEMPIICEAVERAAVANGRKNFVDRGPRRYESSPGELLPQTLPSEPSTAVVEQHVQILSPTFPPVSSVSPVLSPFIC